MGRGRPARTLLTPTPWGKWLVFRVSLCIHKFHQPSIDNVIQKCGRTPVSPALRRQMWEDQEFEASLDYIKKSRSVYIIWGNPVSRNKIKKKIIEKNIGAHA